MERQEAIELIRATVDAETLNELEYRAQVFNEEDEETRDGETMDILDALAEYAALGDEYAGSPDANYKAEGKDIIASTFPVLIALGMYQPISEAAARAAVRTGIGVKLKDFPKFNGKRYQSELTWEQLGRIGAGDQRTPQAYTPENVNP